MTNATTMAQTIQLRTDLECVSQLLNTKLGGADVFMTQFDCQITIRHS